MYDHNISVACYQNHAKTESIRSTICGKCMGEPPEIGSWECSKSSERNSLTRRQSYWYNLVNKIREMVSFGLGKEIEKDFFLSCHEHGTRKRLRVNSHKQSNLRPLGSMLWCSTTESQRLWWAWPIAEFYTFTSVYIFYILLSVHFPRCW